MKVVCSILCILVSLMACQPEPLDVKLEEYEPEIVVSSQVVPDYLMVVGLTRSFTVLSSAGFQGEGDTALFEQLLVDSALVTIESSLGVDTLFQLSPGLFASVNELEDPGGTYHLTVKDYDEGKTATASSTMLKNIPFDTVYPYINEEEELIKMKVEFTDEKDVPNFYVLSVYSRNTNNGGIDVNTFFENGSNNIEYLELITDKEIDGEKIVRDFGLFDVSTKDSLMVSLSNISEGYYSFLVSRERSGNILAEVTNEPINYPSNVENGLGYFNTHYPSLQFFDLTLIEE